jgi:catechol 2,3-dioxygenase-like lactoylglutathione lyase family enzyme
MISGIAHINLTIPQDTLEQAKEFYGTTLGLTSAPVPEAQKGTILWYVPNSDLQLFSISDLFQGSISALADSKCTLHLVQPIQTPPGTHASNLTLVRN